MLLRFFNIVLIAAYFLGGYSQIAGHRYICSLEKTVFTESKNHHPVKTQFFSASLQKHIHTFNQIQLGEHDKEFRAYTNLNRPLLTFYFIPSENDLFKVSLNSYLNKAPPFYPL